MTNSDETDARVLVLSPEDNVAIAKCDLPRGAELCIMGRTVSLQTPILTGHKFAFKAIAVDDKIVKYGAPIGRATRAIAPGESMHIHNVTSDYIPTYTLDAGHQYLKETH